MEDIPPDEGRELYDCEGEEEPLKNIETEEVEDDDADTTVSRRNENAVTAGRRGTKATTESKYRIGLL